jgi:cell pole-organizing protein PopZ
MAHAGEPSVEEILESIKQVIARDNRADAADRHRDRAARGMFGEEAGRSDLRSNDRGLIRDAEDIFDLSELDAIIEGDDVSEAPLLSESARSSMHDSLAALAVLSEPGAQPQIVRSGETSLEDMVRELLRPALATWLDTNLPPLVERLVSAEIARIVGKKG